MMANELYWHVHHDTLLEPLTEPIQNRIEYIKTEKAKYETEKQIELRLRLLRPLIGPLPEKWDKAEAEWDKAEAEWDKAEAELDKARAEWAKAVAELSKARAERDKAEAELDKAEAQHKIEIEALHKKECPNCPWDGSSIFGREAR
jgi:multidrug resistance efflux pump